MNPKLVRYMYIIIEITSLPLFILGLIYILTGYQLLNPEIRLFPYPRLLHTDRALRAVLIILVLLHSYAGLFLMIARRAKRFPAIFYVLLTLSLMAMLGLILIAELTL